MSDLGFTFNGADYLDVGHYLAPADPTESFRAAMMEKIGHAPRRIDGDSRVHRFATSKSGRDDAGWYRLHDDDFPAGSFGDWRTGEKFSWHSREVHQMSTGERQRLEEVKVEREKADEIERAEAAAAAAKARWENAGLAGPDHPYLQTKAMPQNN
jgi:putative DNA primase/helicase